MSFFFFFCLNWTLTEAQDWDLKSTIPRKKVSCFTATFNATIARLDSCSYDEDLFKQFPLGVEMSSGRHHHLLIDLPFQGHSWLAFSVIQLCHVERMNRQPSVYDHVSPHLHGGPVKSTSHIFHLSLSICLVTSTGNQVPLRDLVVGLLFDVFLWY